MSYCNCQTMQSKAETAFQEALCTQRAMTGTYRQATSCTSNSHDSSNWKLHTKSEHNLWVKKGKAGSFVGL